MFDDEHTILQSFLSLNINIRRWRRRRGKKKQIQKWNGSKKISFEYIQRRSFYQTVWMIDSYKWISTKVYQSCHCHGNWYFFTPAFIIIRWAMELIGYWFVQFFFLHLYIYSYIFFFFFEIHLNSIRFWNGTNQKLPWAFSDLYLVVTKNMKYTQEMVKQHIKKMYIDEFELQFPKDSCFRSLFLLFISFSF